MHYVIYLSSATRLYTDMDLEQLLTTSRRNNERLDITGLLLYHDGTIMQVLEGEQTVLLSLYQKIAKDPRHQGVTKMAEGVNSERAFADWTMGFRRMSGRDWSVFSESLNLDPRELLKSPPAAAHPEMMMLIKNFIQANMERGTIMLSNQPAA